MATRGRKPKPTAMKELEGNPGKHPLNTSEPKPNKKAPACPKWLEPEAKKEWRRLAKQMEAIGILTEVDMAAFAGYCQAYARWKEAEEFITQHGTIVKTPSGYWQQVPQVSIAQTNLKIMLKFCEQFGLTPSARSRMVGEENGVEKETDEMELLLRGRQVWHLYISRQRSCCRIPITTRTRPTGRLPSSSISVIPKANGPGSRSCSCRGRNRLCVISSASSRKTGNGSSSRLI